MDIFGPTVGQTVKQGATSLAMLLAAGLIIYTAASLAKFTPAVALYHGLIYAAFFSIYLVIPFEQHFNVPNNKPMGTADIAYYAMVTHSGVGYGDVYPITTAGRVLVMTHLFLVILAVFNMVPVGESTLSFGAFPGQ